MYRWDDTDWKFWFYTDLLLLIGLFVEPIALQWAMLLTVYQCIHFYEGGYRLIALKQQVRMAYLVLLVLGMMPGLGWIHWVQLIGTTSMVTTDYCPLARIMSLMPWNRTLPLSWGAVRRAIFSPPIRQVMEADARRHVAG